MLAIDCGTQSVRAMLFDAQGNLVAKVKEEFTPYFSVQPGWTEQEVDLYYEETCKACQKLMGDYPQYKSFIVGVTVTTQRDTCICLDKELKPLRPAILWMDQRKVTLSKKLPLDKQMMVSLVGMSEAVDSFRKNYKAEWIKQYEAEIWEKTHKYIFLSGYLIYKLSGRLIDSDAAQVGHLPFDYKNRQWVMGNDLKSYIFPIEKEKLIELGLPGEVIGQITEKASRETEIPAGIPIVLSGSDKGCETYGNGCIDAKTASISLGSTATVQTTMDKYCEVVQFVPPYPSVIYGKYNPELQVRRGYWMISWFKNEFAQKEVEQAKITGIAPEIILNRELNKIPPGSHGLLLQPYWGAELKNPEAKGAMIGFGAVHTRLHIYRAIIEGIGYALYEGIEMIEKKSGQKVEQVAISGGGSQSDAICQISADIVNRNTYRVQTYETSGLGAAMVAFQGLEYYKNYQEVVENMVRITDVFEPHKEAAQIYDELYRKIYKQLYKKLSPLYKEIRWITKYPSY